MQKAHTAKQTHHKNEQQPNHLKDSKTVSVMTTTREESQFATPSELPAEPKKRVVRRRTVQTDAEGVEAAPAKKPRATRTRKAKVEAEPPAAEPVAEVTAQEADKPKRRVVRRR